MPEELALVVDRPDPLVSHVLEHVARAAGLRPVPMRGDEVGNRPHLAYGGDGPAGSRGVWIRHDPESPVAVEPVLDGTADPTRHGPRIEWDLVRAIGALLTDEVNRDAGPDDCDDHGRLRYDASWATRAGWGGVPIADRYTSFIGKVVAAVTGLSGVPRWPDGRRAAIALSHDVDEPDRYALLRQAARPWRLRRAPRTLAAEASRLARRRLRDDDPEAFWAFDELCALEAQNGFRSTFFFAVTPFHAPDGTLEDVHYDVTALRYRRAMARLREVGFGIGLHAGYRSFEGPERFVRERLRLEDVSDGPIRGLRHHYWHLGPRVAATLRAHEVAGFRYDSSLAFNDHVGFRRSAGLPFHPYDEAEERPLRTWQLPPFCMDGNLFYGSDDVGAAVRTVAEQVDQIVSVGGFGSIDWHIQASVPRSVEFRPWGVAYGEILAMLAARDDVWVTSLEEVHAWVERRDRDLLATA